MEQQSFINFNQTSQDGRIRCNVFPDFDECANDINAHRDSTGGIENIGGQPF
jgi:hypothetical protein